MVALLTCELTNKKLTNELVAAGLFMSSTCSSLSVSRLYGYPPFSSRNSSNCSGPTVCGSRDRLMACGSFVFQKIQNFCFFHPPLVLCTDSARNTSRKERGSFCLPQVGNERLHRCHNHFNYTYLHINGGMREASAPPLL